MPTYQFIRIAGYRRGPANQKGNLRSIIAEGRRAATHSSHIEGNPSLKIIPVEGEWDDLMAYQAWIERTMRESTVPMVSQGQVVRRRVRSDAIAIGTIITSLPSLTTETSPDVMEAFTQDSIAWARDYLDQRGMRLNYCVQHFDEKYPHIHLWFTPGEAMLAQGEWVLGYVSNPKLKEREFFRKDFFDQVGHRYVDELEKPEPERKPRIDRRRDAVKDRLPPGTPSLSDNHSALGVSFDREAAPGFKGSHLSQRDLEQLEHTKQMVIRAVEALLQNKAQLGALSEERIIEMMVQRTLSDSRVIQEIQDRLLARRQDDNVGKPATPASAQQQPDRAASQPKRDHKAMWQSMSRGKPKGPS